MMVGVPVAAVLLPLAWLLLTRVIYRPGALTGDVHQIIAQERASLGRMSKAERLVAVVFVATALAWILREPKDLGWIQIPGIATFAPGVRDSTIAITASLLLFSIPLDFKRGEFVLDWSSAARIAWGVLLLFGGGLSLARAMDESGLATWIGSGVATLEHVPFWVLIGAATALIVFLTEITSNAATATMAMPIMAGAATALNQPAIALMAAAGLSASMAFMLPVATPPNAIVFSSGYLTIPQMVRAGLIMNLASIVVITAAGVWLIPRVLM
jgi:sodium-dependent dicarboxylate transporter 2/3/5